ncbi:helix-turn-helix transcriptional regulator [Streptosporangium sp. NPDC049078]|uniref:helix-turn-helix transcriptional regulator n=1 Tax=Streptosporangium sp. NPDC049078 TaxID=3155767 RepID=UPI0034245522
MTDKNRPPGYPFWVRAEVARNAAGMSKTDLAKGAGIARRTYDRLEWQKNRALPRVVNAIADVLGIPQSEAARLAGLVPAAAVVEETATGGVLPDPEDVSVFEERLEQILARIPERRRQQLAQIRDDERARYEQRVARVRADYERSVAQLEKLARLDVRAARGEGEGDEDDSPHISKQRQ